MSGIFLIMVHYMAVVNSIYNPVFLFYSAIVASIVNPLDNKLS